MYISDAVIEKSYDDLALKLLIEERIEDNTCKAIRVAQKYRELTRVPTIMRYIQEYEKGILQSDVEEALDRMIKNGGLVREPSVFGYLYSFPERVEAKVDIAPLIGRYE
jgi:hypothetical protein